VSVVDAIRKANRPGEPESSIRLRVACWGVVLVAIAACASLHEVSSTTAIAAAALVSLGMVFSYRTRQKPPNWIKVAVAIGAIAALVWFFRSVSGSSPDFALVENPLTLLLVSVLVLHSFHVPARRDLLFSLAASAGLMAVGGAQAISLQFGFYVIAWAGFGLWGLCEMWTSASGGGRISVPSLVCALGAISAAAAAVFLVLPAPVVSSRVAFLSRAGVGGSVGVPGALAGDSGTPAQLARAGNTNGSTRVGGYLGFAQTLDTALRGRLGNQLVMQVRASRPSFWVGETFDTWLGESWVQSKTRSQPLRQSLPFVLPPSAGSSLAGEPDLQTFYVAGTSANLVFHAESASELWFPSSRVFVSANGTIVSPIGLGSGSIYTVESLVDDPTASQLRADDSPLSLPAATRRQSLQLPHSYPRATSLALSITAHDATTYDKVEALIGWMGRHTRYSTDIPPLPKGADSVDEFLFGNRVGFCEQISTSLAVMLRSIGIPAREAVGFVPGGYNPITDLFQVHANDAHAWVQVWFPGFGWQSFDPTAVVPATAPSPGATALDDVAGALRRVPWVPVVAVVLGVGLSVSVVRLRRRRPQGWDARVAHSMERAGRRVARSRGPGETLPEYARSLDVLTGDGVDTWAALAREVEASTYGGRTPSAAAQRDMVRTAKRTRVPRRGRIRVRNEKIEKREKRDQQKEELTAASTGR
jgi:transglutaminase-like putative cysteine protease